MQYDLFEGKIIPESLFEGLAFGAERIQTICAEKQCLASNGLDQLVFLVTKESGCFESSQRKLQVSLKLPSLCY